MGVAGECRDTSCGVVIPQGAITGSVIVGPDAASLRAALTRQPVTVSVWTGNDFVRYHSGVFDQGCVNHNIPSEPVVINHAVTAVGFGPGFFKLRNSWGSEWGDAGYILIAQEASEETLRPDGGKRGCACIFDISPAFPALSASPIPAPTPVPSP